MTDGLGHESSFEPKPGRDVIVGGPGNDSFWSAEQTSDRLYGGLGTDWASIDRWLDQTYAIERITRYEPEE